MSEMVEIKAEALKWCPYGFEFSLDGITRTLREARLGKIATQFR